MKALYLLLILLGLLLTYRIIVIQIKSKRKLPKSITKNPVFQDLMKFQELMAIEETINEQVKGGYGLFGYTVTNPIPVKGVMGETNYLSRLRTPEGIKVEYRRLGSEKTDNLNHPVDKYEIRVDGIVKCRLYLYPYCKERSRKAPEGYYLIG